MGLPRISHVKPPLMNTLMSARRAVFLKKLACVFVAASMLSPPAALAAGSEVLYRIPLKTGATDGEGALELRPELTDFGSAAVTQTRMAQATLVNTGSWPVSGIQARTSAPFAVDSSECGTLAAGASCKLLLSFSPTVTGFAASNLSVRSSAGDITGQLLGNGARLLTDIEVSSDLWYFGNWPLGETSDSRQLVLHNKGNKPFTFSQLGLVAGETDYTLDSECGATLGAGAYCVVRATFTPSTRGLRMGAFRIQGADGSLRDVNMVGYGGMGAVPGARLSVAAAVSFGDVQVGTVPADQRLVVTNIGTESLSLAPPVMGGADQAAFRVATTCEAELRPWSSCEMTVGATNLGQDLRSYEAAITLASSDAEVPREIPVFANVTRPSDARIQVSPNPLKLDATAMGVPVSGTLTLTNTGPNPTSVTRVISSSPLNFTAASSCTAELAVDDSCDITVTYVARSGGAVQGALDIGTTAGDTYNVPLYGLLPSPSVHASPSPVVFDDATVVGTATEARRVEISNDGTGPLTISGISVVDSTLTNTTTVFAQNNSCGSELGAGKSCFVDVTFRPQEAATVRGAVMVTSNDPIQPAMPIWLEGRGIEGSVSVALTPSSVNFGGAPVGQSVQVSLQVKNTGSLPTQVTGASIPEDQQDVFTQSNACGDTMAPGAACAITLQFVPAELGDRTGTLTLTLSNGETREVPLFGRGADASVRPQMTVLPGALDLGLAMLGRNPATSEFRITNRGDGPLRIAGVSVLDETGNAVSREFASSNNCGNDLPSNASCTVNVGFTPLATGVRTGTVAIETNDPTNPVFLVSVRGTGYAGRVSVSPLWGMKFPDVQVGRSSTLPVTVFNESNTPALVTGVGIQGGASGFTQVNACGEQLSSGGRCDIMVTFEPSTVGAANDTLVVQTSDGSNFQVALSGNALEADPSNPPVPASGVTASPNPVEFGQVKTRTTSSIPVVLTNNTTQTQVLRAVTLAKAQFSAANSCVGSLAAGQSCSFIVSVRPTANGMLSDSLGFQFVDSQYDGSIQVSALGVTEVVPPTLAVSATNLNFGLVDSASPAVRTVTVHNTGTVSASFGRAALVQTGSDISMENGCEATLEVGATCDIRVTYAGTTRGPANGKLTLSPMGGTAIEIGISGSGMEPELTVSTPELVFPDTGTLLQSAERTVTVSNTGTAPLAIAQVYAPEGFSATNECPATLPVGENCTVGVRFAPASAKEYTEYLQIRTDARLNGTAGIALRGRGVGPQIQLTPDALTFAQQPMGGFEFKTVQVANLGAGGARMDSFRVTPEDSGFTVTHACPGILASQESCDVSVRFSPTAGGAHYASLDIGHDGATERVALRGDGPPSLLTLLSDVVTLPGQALQVPSLEYPVTVVNSGVVAARVYEATLPAGSTFKVTRNECTAPLAARATCSIYVTVTPTAAGSLQDTLTIRSSRTDGDLLATLQGTGVRPTAAIAPATLDFGAMYTGKSRTLSATVTNTGSYPLVVQQVNGDAQFSGKVNCEGPVAAGATCDIAVTASPNAGGLQQGTVTVRTTAGDLVVTGRTQATQVTLASVIPSKVGTAGGEEVMLTGTGFGASPRVSFGGALATSVRALSSTQIAAVVPAHAPGAVTVSVVEGDAPAVALSEGLTFVAAPTLKAINPNKGGAAGNWQATLAGTNLECDMTVLVDGKAAGVSACTGDTATIAVPARSVNTSGLVDVTVRNAGGQSTLTRGLEYVQDAGRLVLTSGMGEFGNILRGTTTVRTVALTNEGTLPAQIRSVGVTGMGFRLVAGKTGACSLTMPAVLGAKQSCLYSIEVSGDEGSTSGMLRINAGGADEVSLPLSASFVFPNFVFSSQANSTEPVQSAFDAVAALSVIGKPNSPVYREMNVFFNNVGLIEGVRLQNATLTMSGPNVDKFTITRAFQSSNAGATVATAGSLSADKRSVTGINTSDGTGTSPHLGLVVRYTPTTDGVDIGQIRLDYGDGNFALLPLVGSAVYDVEAQLSGNSNFGDVTYNQSAGATVGAKAQTFQIRATTTVPEAVVQVTRLQIAGVDAKAFAFVSCNGSATPTQNCVPTNMIQSKASDVISFEVRFTPTRVGQHKATLIVQHSGINDGGTQVLNLEGNAIRDVELKPSGGANVVAIPEVTGANGTPVPANYNPVTANTFLRNMGAAGQVIYSGVQIEGSPAFTLTATGLLNHTQVNSTSQQTWANVRSAALRLIGADPSVASSQSDLQVQLSFKPTTGGTHRATVTVFHDGPGGQTSYEVVGQAENQAGLILKGDGVATTNGEANFGVSDPAGGKELKIAMTQPTTGGSKVRLDSIQLTGRDADQFIITKVIKQSPYGPTGGQTTWYDNATGTRSLVVNGQFGDAYSYDGVGTLTLKHVPTRSGTHEVDVVALHSGADGETKLRVIAAANFFADFKLPTNGTVISSDGFTAVPVGMSYYSGGAMVGMPAGVKKGKWYAEFRVSTPMYVGYQLALVFGVNPYMQYGGWTSSANVIFNADYGSVSSTSGLAEGTTAASMTNYPQANDRIAVAMDVDGGWLRFYHYSNATGVCNEVKAIRHYYPGTPLNLQISGVRSGNYQNVTLTNGAIGDYACPMPAGYEPLPNVPSAATGG